MRLYQSGRISSSLLQFVTCGIEPVVWYFFFREAAEDAGFDVLRVISQPAAAALAYGKVNRNFFSVIMGQMTFTAQ